LVQIMMNLGLRRTGTTLRDEARGRRIMRRVGLQLALLAIVTLAFSAASRAKVSHVGASRHSVAAKIRYCEDCHGLSAQGFRGYYPIPRLAGQQPQYLENQLRAFVERNRPNPIMSNVAHVLRPAMIKAIVARFQRLHPRPAGPGPKRLVAAGRSIFENGVPQDNVAACAACHGPDATGHGEIPRLAGQLYPYVVKELINWPKERGQNPANPDTSLIMKPVAHSLTKRQIEAVAAFVSNLR
jgi:cytochrome c553